MTSEPRKPGPGRGGWLLRGESLIGAAGLAFAFTIAGVTAGSSWWALREQERALVSARQGEILALGEALSLSAGAMLAGDELSALRRLVVESGRTAQLTGCRVVLGGGQVVADAEPSRVSGAPLPDVWPSGTDLAAQTSLEGLSLRTPVVVPGRGVAELQIDAGRAREGDAWAMHAGVAAIGGVALVVTLGVYRGLRSRLRGVSAIGEALLAWGEGERSSAALGVHPGWGAAAQAWNALLSEHDAAQDAGRGERVAEALGERRERRGDLSSACDAMWQGLVIVDDDLTLRYANGAAAVFLQGDREAMQSGRLEDFVKDAGVLEAVRGVATGTIRRRTNVEVDRREGRSREVLRFSVRPVRKEDAGAAMVVIEDITQQRVAEDARHAFVAQATHELRTPLTNMRLYIEQCLEEGDNDPLLRAKALNVINQEARRLERIVGDMLSVAEIEAGALKLRVDDIRLDALFAELESDYRAQASDKNIVLEFKLPPKLPVIKGDRDKVVVALQNLVGNALKYTPKDGRVGVSVRVDRDRVSVSVTDTGIGIAPEEQELIFDRFYRAKDTRIAGITGSGLGLALAREVVRLHGGDITVESQINKGSTFTMTLPAAEAAV